MPADRNDLQHALLARWAAAPSRALADAICALPTSELPGVRGKTKAAVARWRAVAQRPSAAERPGLYAAIADVTARDAVLRLAACAKLGPDPRFDRALVALLERPPYHATSTQPFYTALFAHLKSPRAVDPRLVARVAAADFSPVAATMRTWLARERAKLLAVLAERPALPAGSAPAELAAQPAARDLAALWDAVYTAADPDDDLPRSILADALIEVGDPRGEFIALQLRGGPDRAAAQLLAAHGKTWLGPLAGVLAADFRFERGFLARCTIPAAKARRAIALAGDPRWSTVRSFAGPAAIALHPAMRALTMLTIGPVAHAALLTDAPRPRLHALHYTPSGAPGERAALARCAALPNLRTLELRGAPLADVLAIADGPVIERLQCFGVRTGAASLAPLAPLLARAPTPHCTLVLDHGGYHPTVVELARGLDGSPGYARATLELGPTTRGTWSAPLVAEALALLDLLPALREVDLATRRHLEPGERARLVRAIAARGLALD